MNKKKILTSVAASVLLVVAALLSGKYLADNEDVKRTIVKGVFHFMPDGHPDAQAVNHLYSFTVSPNGDKSKSTEWGTVSFSTEVELIGKEKIEEFDGCLVELRGSYIEFPAEKSLNHHLFKRLKIKLIFN